MPLLLRALFWIATPVAPPSIITDIPLGAGEVLLEANVEEREDKIPYLAPRAEALRARCKPSRDGTVHDA
ncbi:hypothetical protein BGZ76_001189 [Entomortierella beljakovae]|nr:hypothetical protein BGZ76_001189 [Entomortierella beljakovae]